MTSTLTLPPSASTLEHPFTDESLDFPQLFFHLNNIHDPSHPLDDTIYSTYPTSQASLNHLQFTISTNITTSFTPGKGPVPREHASTATGSFLYLDLAPLNLTSLDDQAFSAKGWKFQSYGSVLCMYVDPQGKPISLGLNEPLVVCIAQLAVPHPPAGAGVVLTTTCYRIPSITDDKLGIPFNFKVMIQNSSQEGNQNLQDQITFAFAPESGSIINTIPHCKTVNNSLTFTLRPNKQVAVPAGPKTTFTLSFVYAEDKEDKFGYGALTTPNEAVKFQMTTYPSNWTLTSPEPGSVNPAWLFHPQDGVPLVGTEEGSVIEFTLDNIVTSFQPGPTLLYFSYQNVPDYEDGSYYAVLEKVPHVDIVSCTVDPNPSELDKTRKAAEVTLKWIATHATLLTLSSPSLGSVDVTGCTQYKTKITQDTLFTLTAEGKGADMGNIAYANVSACIKLAIHSFSCVPSKIYSRQFADPYKVRLSWNVNTNGQVKLTSNLPEVNPIILDSAEEKNYLYEVKAPQEITLSPLPINATQPCQDQFPQEKRSVTISQFSIDTPRKISLNITPDFIAFSPSGDLIAVLDYKQSVVLFLDTTDYQPLLGPGQGRIPAGKRPLSLAFSPDGSLLAIRSYSVPSHSASHAEHAVSFIKITKDDKGSPTFTPLFLSQQPPHLSPSVGGIANIQEIALSHDGQFLYLLTDALILPGALSILRMNPSHPFPAEDIAIVRVGLNPRGLTALPSGEIWLANAGDSSLFVIQPSQGKYTISHKISLERESVPVSMGLASTGDDSGPCLLVACKGSNKVHVIDPADSYSKSKQIISIAHPPQQIAVMKEGRYAFINNFTNGSIALLGYDSNLEWRILESNIETGSNKPSSAIAMHPNGRVLAVAHASNHTLSIFDV